MRILKEMIVPNRANSMIRGKMLETKHGDIYSIDVPDTARFLAVDLDLEGNICCWFTDCNDITTRIGTETEEWFFCVTKTGLSIDFQGFVDIYSKDTGLPPYDYQYSSYLGFVKEEAEHNIFHIYQLFIC